MGKALIADETDPWPPRAYPIGTVVRLPIGGEGLIVDYGPTANTRIVAWRSPMTGNAVEATLPTASLAVLLYPPSLRKKS